MFVSQHSGLDSALNVIRAPIRSIAELGNRARLAIGSVSAEITDESLARLGVEPGRDAYATFKATGTRVVAEHQPRDEGESALNSARGTS
jgi:molybdopterin-binding protein